MHLLLRKPPSKPLLIHVLIINLVLYAALNVNSMFALLANSSDLDIQHPGSTVCFVSHIHSLLILFPLEYMIRLLPQNKNGSMCKLAADISAKSAE